MKKDTGKALVLYPVPLIVAGRMVDGKPNDPFRLYLGGTR